MNTIGKPLHPHPPVQRSQEQRQQADSLDISPLTDTTSLAPSSDQPNSLLPGPLATVYRAFRDVLTGQQRDSRFEARRSYSSPEEARNAFEEAKERFLQPNDWQKLGPKWGAARFTVMQPDGSKDPTGTADVGDLLSIKLPDPGPPVWVGIEDVSSLPDRVRIVVRPCADPNRNSDAVIHLFGKETTNIFELERQDDTVVASVSGKNETRNLSGNVLQDLFAGIRLAGAWMGAKKPQWRAFTENMLVGAYRGMQQPNLKSEK